MGIAILCLSLFTIKAVTSLVQESATWDETGCLGIGKSTVRSQPWDTPGAILHPPLSYYIGSIPLLFFPGDPHFREFHGDHAADRRGQALLASPENRGDRLLDLSRLMMVLTALVLGWFVYLWSRSLYGEAASMLAVVLFSFCPNILAHARLITPDITVTTFSFIALYFFWRLLRNDSTGGAVLGGLCFGLALLSKSTSVLLWPVCLVLMLLSCAQTRTLKWRKPLLFAAIAMGIVCLGYGMNPRPYFAGISEQQRAAQLAPPVFFMGHYASRWWDYFLVAFLLKTPVAVLLFLAVAAVLFVNNTLTGQWIDDAFLLLPAVTIFCFCSLKEAQVGLRHVLPAYPFLFVFASRSAQIFVSHKFRLGLGLAALGWYIGASCGIHPHYLAYFNELAGGPDNGWKYLVDSNLDWGQDLKGLKRFMDEHGIARISLSYFGTDSPERYGIAYDWLPSPFLRDPDPNHHPSRLKGWVAISASNLQGAQFTDKDLFACFRTLKPVAKVGYSIFIYKLDGWMPIKSEDAWPI